MPKAKKQKQTPTEAPKFDAKAPQTIGISVNDNLVLRHTLEPLTDERFFRLADDLEAADGVAEQLGIKAALWDELCSGVTGYKERPDWKRGVPDTHKAITIEALRGADVRKIGDDDASEVFDIDAPVTVHLSATHNDSLLNTLSISFKQESKAEMESFLALRDGLGDPNALASAARTSTAREMHRIGKRLMVSHEGYEAAPPASHLVIATMAFFLSELASAKKHIA